MRQRSAAGTGFVALDVLKVSGSYSTYAGGTCANVLAVLAYLGWSARVVGRIGADTSGSRIVRDLARFKVDTSQLSMIPGDGTPVVVEELLPRKRGGFRHRFRWNCPHCDSRLPQYRPLAKKAAIAAEFGSGKLDVFFLDRITPGTVQAAENAKMHGAHVVLEPSGVGDDRLFSRCLEVASVFKYSHGRLPGVAERFTNRRRVPLEIETQSDVGLRYRLSKGRWTELDAFDVGAATDAVGSGDWLTAGLLDRLVGGARTQWTSSRVRSAIRFGQALAAINCLFVGARGLMYKFKAKETRKLAARLLDGEAPGVERVNAVAGEVNWRCQKCAA